MIFLSLVVLSVFIAKAQSDTFSAVCKIQGLVKTEKGLFTAFKEYIKAEELLNNDVPGDVEK